MKLILRKVSVDRAERRVIDDLSLDVAPGEAVILRGPNGAGKTTLIRAVAGLLNPSAGAIALVDELRAPEHDDIPVAERCHYVGHLNALKSALTVTENLAFWAEYMGAAAPADLDAALAAFDLETLADIPAGYLSAGQKRRAALARLLVAQRPLWLLDEPTVSLDTASVARLARVIDAHTAKGGLVLAATHLPLGLAGEREFVLGQRTGAAP